MRDSRAQQGFTLVEVMIALAILAVALTLLLRGASVNVASTQRSQLMTAATELARGKMYDVEERLQEEGFQQLDVSEEGDFEEEGWEQIKWELEILKIELPNLEAMQGFGAPAAEGGEGGEQGGAGGMLGGLLGGMGGSDGGAGAGLIGSQFEVFRGIMEEAIRKVHLKVSYKVAGYLESFTVDCYFTDPAAVNRIINLGPGAGGEGDGGDASDGGSGGSGGSGGGSGGSSGRQPSTGKGGGKGG